MQIIGPEGSKLAIIGDQPSKEEYVNGRAFSSWKTKVFKDCIRMAGTSEHQCYTGFITTKPHSSGYFSGYYEDSKGIFPGDELKEYMEKFTLWFEKTRPNAIVAVGDFALRLLTGQGTLNDLRGYIVPSNISEKHIAKVIGTFEPKRLFPEPHHMFTVTMDIKKGIMASESSEFPEITKSLIPSATPDQFIEYCDWIVESTSGGGVKDIRYPFAEEVLTGVALDIENTIGSGCHITQFGLGHSGEYAMTINFLKGKSPALSEPDELRVWQAIGRVANSKAKFIAHNGGHDLAVTWMNNHILFKIDFDTMLAGQLLYPELLKSLKFLCSLCLDVKPWKHVSAEDTYNPEDVANTRSLRDVLYKRLEARDLLEIFGREISQIPVASLFELRGLKVNEKKRKLLLRRYTKYALKLKKLLDKESIKATRKIINYNSPAQVAKFLYEDLGLPVQYKRRKSVKDKRKMTTGKEALITLCQKTTSLVPKLMLKHRKAAKAISTYLDFEVSTQGTIHASFNIGSTVERFKQKDTPDSKALGRWSCSQSIILPFGPKNLHAIPEYSRSMYIPFHEDWEIACGDYVQAEAVVVAYLSKDEPLIAAIERGNALRDALRQEINPSIIKIIKKKLNQVDIHKLKAVELFSKDLEKISKDERQIGKATRHATNYIAGPKVLQVMAAQGDIYQEIAYWKSLMAIDAIKSPAKYKWHRAIADELGDNKRVLSNPFGRHRKFLGEWNEDLIKAGCAFKPQSTIGDLLNEALVILYNKWGDRLLDILLQLHDGMYISYPKKDRYIWLKRLRDCMTIPIIINGREVTVDVELKVGPNWGELKDVNY